ncbi:hypothetical protein NL676_036706 [Syzygium grande]|nr:hypothetical protein NL676_036706 [Syzygium grande]
MASCATPSPVALARSPSSSLSAVQELTPSLLSFKNHRTFFFSPLILNSLNFCCLDDSRTRHHDSGRGSSLSLVVAAVASVAEAEMVEQGAEALLLLLGKKPTARARRRNCSPLVVAAGLVAAAARRSSPAGCSPLVATAWLVAAAARRSSPRGARRLSRGVIAAGRRRLYFYACKRVYSLMLAISQCCCVDT